MTEIVVAKLSERDVDDLARRAYMIVPTAMPVLKDLAQIETVQLAVSGLKDETKPKEYYAGALWGIAYFLEQLEELALRGAPKEEQEREAAKGSLTPARVREIMGRVSRGGGALVGEG